MKKIAITCLLLALAACGSDYFEYVDDLHVYPIVEEHHGLTLLDVLAIANNRRNEITQPNNEFVMELIQAYVPPEVATYWDDFSHGQRNSTISTEEAIYDVKVLFDLLRYYYAAYHYFGGDEAFLPVRDNIIEVLSTREEWSSALFGSVLRDSLSEVIADNHFSIDNVQVGATSNFFVWEMPFDKSEDGFRRRDTGLYVREIVGHCVNEVFRLAMNEEGEFFYIPIVVTPGGSTYNLTIIFENGVTETLSSLAYRTIQRRFQEPSLRFEGNIPIVNIQWMADPRPLGAGGMEDAKYFLSFAEELQHEDVIIVDIRGNMEGYTFLSQMWLYLLTGEIVPNNFRRLGIPRQLSEAAMELYESLLYNAPDTPFDDLIIYLNELGMPPFGNYHMLCNNPDRVIPNDRLIILLIDRFVGSAAEIFTDHMLNMENTLIIGQNTSGNLLTGGAANRPYLPNSGIPVNVGWILSVFDDGNFTEGIGIAPDVWVTGDALTAALAMLDRWGSFS